MRLWVSFLVVSILFTSLVSSAPTKKEDAIKTTADSKSGVKTVVENEQTGTETSSTQSDSAFSVPSSALQNESMLKSVSLTQGHKKDNDFLSKETKNMGSKKSKSTESKLLKMVFDDKDNKESLTESGASKQKKSNKKDAKHVKKTKPKSRFNVFKVKNGKHGERDRDTHGRHSKKLHSAGYPRKYRDYYREEEKYLSRAHPEYDDEDYYGTHRYPHSYLPERSYHGSEREGHGRKKMYHPRRKDYDDRDDDNKEDDVRSHSYAHTETFKGNVSPQDLGFDKEGIESLFGQAYRPGGFGTDSMGKLDHSRKMFSHGFHGGAY